LSKFDKFVKEHTDNPDTDVFRKLLEKEKIKKSGELKIQNEINKTSNYCSLTPLANIHNNNSDGKNKHVKSKSTLVESTHRPSVILKSNIVITKRKSPEKVSSSRNGLKSSFTTKSHEGKRK
jgi:hypothetical protein